MSQTTTPHPTQQVFEQVLARVVEPPDLHHARLVHVYWRAPTQGARVVQVYVDGQWSGVSASPTEREVWLILDGDRRHEIELLAVDPHDAATPSHQLLSGVSPPTSPYASVRVMRDASLPTDTRVSVAVDGQVAKTTALFLPTTPRGGFGAVFGEGGFGYDAALGPGLGFGQLGLGPLGADGRALQWRDGSLPIGLRSVQVTTHDAEGNAITPALDIDFTITRLPDPPAGVELNADLQLTWN